MSTSVALAPYVIQQFLDNTGKPCIGGSLQTQVGGVNYPTYSEPTGTTALPNPIPLNSRGEVSTSAGASSELFLQVGVSYTFILKDANGNQLWSIGNVVAGSTNSNPTATGTANAQVITNATPITAIAGTIQWFFPVASNTGATTLNVDNNGAKNLFYLSKALVGGELWLGNPALAIYDGTQWNLAWSAKGPVTDYYVDSGIVNTITVAVVNAEQFTTGLANGLRIKVKASNTNTASSAILNILSAGSLSGGIYYSDGVTLIAPGAIVSGNIYDFIWNSSLSGGAWICVNPSRVTGSFTGTGTGFSGTAPTATITYRTDASFTFCALVFGTGMTGTSNATTFTITGMPSFLTPAQTQAYYCTPFDGGSSTQGSVIFTASSTTITLAKNAVIGTGLTNWTASGTKAFASGALAGQNSAITFVIP